MQPGAAGKYTLECLLWMHEPGHPEYKLRWSSLCESEARISVQPLLELPVSLNFLKALDLIYRSSRSLQFIMKWSDLPWQQLLLQSWLNIVQCIDGIVTRQHLGTENPKWTLSNPSHLLESACPFPTPDVFQAMIERLMYNPPDDDDALVWNLANWLRKRSWLLPLWSAAGVWQDHDALLSDGIGFLLLSAAIQIDLCHVDDEIKAKKIKLEESESTTTSLTNPGVQTFMDRRNSIVDRKDILVEVWDQTSKRLAEQFGLDVKPLSDARIKANVLCLISLFIIEHGRNDHLFWGIAARWSSRS